MFYSKTYMFLLFSSLNKLLFLPFVFLENPNSLCIQKYLIVSHYHHLCLNINIIPRQKKTNVFTICLSAFFSFLTIDHSILNPFIEITFNNISRIICTITFVFVIREPISRIFPFISFFQFTYKIDKTAI